MKIYEILNEYLDQKELVVKLNSTADSQYILLYNRNKIEEIKTDILDKLVEVLNDRDNYDSLYVCRKRDKNNEYEIFQDLKQGNVIGLGKYILWSNGSEYFVRKINIFEYSEEQHNMYKQHYLAQYIDCNCLRKNLIAKNRKIYNSYEDAEKDMIVANEAYHVFLEKRNNLINEWQEFNKKLIYG